MAARFDKRAMGHPIPGRDDENRPSLKSFQDEVSARNREGRQQAHPQRAPADELADKVAELTVEGAEPHEPADGRTLAVSAASPRRRPSGGGADDRELAAGTALTQTEARRTDYCTRQM